MITWSSGLSNLVNHTEFLLNISLGHPFIQFSFLFCGACLRRGEWWSWGWFGVVVPPFRVQPAGGMRGVLGFAVWVVAVAGCAGEDRFPWNFF